MTVKSLVLFSRPVSISVWRSWPIVDHGPGSFTMHFDRTVGRE